VTKNKLWKEISIPLEIGQSASAAFNVRKKYVSLGIFHLECKYDRNGLDPLPLIAEMEKISSSNKKPSKQNANNKTNLANNNNSNSNSNTDSISSSMNNNNAQQQQQQPTTPTTTTTSSSSSSLSSTSTTTIPTSESNLSSSPKKKKNTKEKNSKNATNTNQASLSQQQQPQQPTTNSPSALSNHYQNQMQQQQTNPIQINPQMTVAPHQIGSTYSGGVIQNFNSDYGSHHLQQNAQHQYNSQIQSSYYGQPQQQGGLPIRPPYGYQQQQQQQQFPNQMQYPLQRIYNHAGGVLNSSQNLTIPSSSGVNTTSAPTQSIPMSSTMLNTSNNPVSTPDQYNQQQYINNSQSTTATTTTTTVRYPASSPSVTPAPVSLATPTPTPITNNSNNNSNSTSSTITPFHQMQMQYTNFNVQNQNQYSLQTNNQHSAYLSQQQQQTQSIIPPHNTNSHHFNVQQSKDSSLQAPQGVLASNSAVAVRSLSTEDMSKLSSGNLKQHLTNNAGQQGHAAAITTSTTSTPSSRQHQSNHHHHHHHHHNNNNSHSHHHHHHHSNHSKLSNQIPNVNTTSSLSTLTSVALPLSSQLPQGNFMTQPKKEIVFPPDSVESTNPIEVKKRRITAKDIGNYFFFYFAPIRVIHKETHFGRFPISYLVSILNTKKKLLLRIRYETGVFLNRKY
jgi:hypothetical protein